MKAYTPTVASANTSSPVKTNFSNLAGTAPMQVSKASPQPNSNPHVRIGPQSFNKQPSMSTFRQHEQRQGPIPHISMKPGSI